MSTILKALRKLEEDNAHRGPRPLRDEVTTAGGTRDHFDLVMDVLAAKFAGLIGAGSHEIGFVECTKHDRRWMFVARALRERVYRSANSASPVP